MKGKKRVSRADWLTLLNAICGIMAIWYFQERQFLWGATLLITAMVFDGLDGYAARRWGSSHNMGTYLDSIADSISFALAPAIAIYTAFYDPESAGALTFDDPSNTLAVVASMTLALAGITRLARFSRKHTDIPHFKGLATPLAAGLVMFMILIFGPDTYNGYYGLGSQPLFVMGAVLVISFLELVPIPFPKAKGRVLVPFAAILIFVGFVPPLAYVFINPISTDFFINISRTASSFALIIFSLYLFVTPVLMFLRGRRCKT